MPLKVHHVVKSSNLWSSLFNTAVVVVVSLWFEHRYYGCCGMIRMIPEKLESCSRPSSSTSYCLSVVSIISAVI